ncbi:hypothetical protein [Gimesia chilikensis]|uniref:J domain-containing protein n=1 Tax=Gimesia chilikensis TaxID=2605989 RepID=A0A517PGP4_9PLAN|nr:hypothetical protein [Gimesia chilikensis]MBN67977.1 hypothetical protein [Gimesia sp.]QDT18547.1 hypothetical protein HG66A1_03080 [Gimesia chilikensis]QDT82675.1 hypothetical protein MalM14_03040 [Gimesia chilikensis]
MSFDAYHKWLGIPPEQQPPHYYQLLGISTKETDREVIETAAQRQRSIIEENLHGPHRKVANQLLYEIDEAELTLLSPELREVYDQQVTRAVRKQKRNQSGHNLDPDSNQPAGEGSGLLERYLAITSVILVGFLIMAWFAYQKPRSEEEKKVLRAQPINAEHQPQTPETPTVKTDSPTTPPQPVPSATTKAAAIEWIFSVGGGIRTSNGQTIERVTDLPSEPFEVTTIILSKCEVTDATLPNILPLTSVQSILLNANPITNKSIATINQFDDLQNLYLADTKITSQGIAALNDQFQLNALYLNNNRSLNDEIIKDIVQYPKLTRLSLAETSITGQALDGLSTLNKLITLQIHLTEIDDASLDQLQAFPELQELLLGSPSNSEQAILNTLQYFDSLKILWIFDVPFTDAGVNRLSEMKTLKEIRLIRTDITDTNLNLLKQALPAAKITVEK